MTFISFPNIWATSENNQYRVEIVGAPGDEFFRDQSGFVYRLFHFDQCVWEWIPDPEVIEVLTQGTTQQETLLRIGAPDFIQRDDWEYDYLTPDGGYTARIQWADSTRKNLTSAITETAGDEGQPRIAKVEILPPQWKYIVRRDHQLI